MEVFALGILVVQIAERDGKPELAPFYLGLMGLARALPGIPCTLIAGAVADRVDRRRILFVTQSTMAVTALVLAVLAYVGLANLAAVLVAATIQSAAFSYKHRACTLRPQSRPGEPPIGRSYSGRSFSPHRKSRDNSYTYQRRR